MQNTRRNLTGTLFAMLSSSTFGLVPLFTITLLNQGLGSFEVLTYRWGLAAAALGTIGLLSGARFCLRPGDLGVVFLLSLFRAACSLGLVVAYQHIASGVASTIHFLYPLAVTVAMTLFFRERNSVWVLVAVGLSLAGVLLLARGDVGAANGNPTIGIAAAVTTIFSYGGYIVGLRKTRAARLDSAAVTFYVMLFGAAIFFCAGQFTTGVRLLDDWNGWRAALGLALVPTAVSNLALMLAVKRIGPTRTSILGSLEPLTAVVIGVLHFGERFTWSSAAGVALILAAVTIVVLRTAPPEEPKEA